MAQQPKQAEQKLDKPNTDLIKQISKIADSCCSAAKTPKKEDQNIITEAKKLTPNPFQVMRFCLVQEEIALLEEAAKKNHRDKLAKALFQSKPAEPKTQVQLMKEEVYKHYTEKVLPAILKTLNKPVRDALGMLVVAIKAGDYQAFCGLLEKNPQLINSHEATIGLFLVIEKNRVAMLRLLLSKGINPDIRLEDGFNALHAAAQEGRIHCVRYLLDKHPALVNSQTKPFGATALHIAAQRGHEQIIDLLLQRGADPDMREADGFNPLHSAAQLDQVDCLSSLLAARPELLNSKESKEGRVHALYMAIINGREKAVRFLMKQEDIELGVDEDKTPGKNVLHLAANTEHSECLKAILDSKPELINSKASYGGETVLFKAGYGGETALFVAMQNDRRSNVDILLARGADPTTYNILGYNVLHLAVMGGKIEYVQLLLKYHPNLINSRTMSQFPGRQIPPFTPFDLALLYSDLALVDQLIPYGPEISIESFHDLIIRQKVSAITYLLSHEKIKIDLSAKNPLGKTALELALMASPPNETICKLIRQRIDVDQQKAEGPKPAEPRLAEAAPPLSSYADIISMSAPQLAEHRPELAGLFEPMEGKEGEKEQNKIKALYPQEPAVWSFVEDWHKKCQLVKSEKRKQPIEEPSILQAQLEKHRQFTFAPGVSIFLPPPIESAAAVKAKPDKKQQNKNFQDFFEKHKSYFHKRGFYLMVTDEFASLILVPETTRRACPESDWQRNERLLVRGAHFTSGDERNGIKELIGASDWHELSIKGLNSRLYSTPGSKKSSAMDAWIQSIGAMDKISATDMPSLPQTVSIIELDGFAPTHEVLRRKLQEGVPKGESLGF